MKTPEISIIIPAYNEASLIGRTLDSIKEAAANLDGPDFCEIIVVDNNSTDATAEIAGKHGAIVIPEEEHKIARVRNAGAAAARGRFLIFIDADTKINKEVISKAYKLMAGGKVIGGGAYIVSEGAPDVRFYGKCIYGLVHLLNYACGAFLFCTREAYNETGGFNETYYAMEELIFSHALKKYARKYKKKFMIMRDSPVHVSARKIDHLSRWDAFKTVMALIFTGPKMIKSREHCSYWYHERRG